MSKHSTANSDPTQTLRKLALSYPEVQEAIACKGTALESCSFKARDKAFLFIGGAGPYTIRVKLRESQAEATQLAKKEPERYKLGANGWASLTFSAAAPPPAALLARWIDESYRILAHKSLVMQLPEGSAPRA